MKTRAEEVLGGSNRHTEPSDSTGTHDPWSSSASSYPPHCGPIGKAAQQSNTDGYTDEQIDQLLTDRWACIKPALRKELCSALGPTDVTRSHSEVLRRNVAAHPRAGNAAHLQS